MCGRYSLSVTPAEARALFGYDDQPNFPPRTNISPTEPIGIVMEHEGARRFMLVRWGFIPTWVKDPSEFPLLFNARGETLADKPAFRNALRRRRCLVPADGFYEWRREGTGARARKVPYHVRRRDGRPMAMGGLWETWIGADGSEIDTAAIITTPANGIVAALHDRMPLIIEPEDFSTWLDCRGEDPRAALALVRPASDDAVAIEPCDPRQPRSEAQGTLFSSVASNGAQQPRSAGADASRDTAAEGPAQPPEEPEQGSLF